MSSNITIAAGIVARFERAIPTKLVADLMGVGIPQANVCLQRAVKAGKVRRASFTHGRSDAGRACGRPQTMWEMAQ